MIIKRQADSFKMFTFFMPCFVASLAIEMTSQTKCFPLQAKEATSKTKHFQEASNNLEGEFLFSIIGYQGFMKL